MAAETHDNALLQIALRREFSSEDYAYDEAQELYAARAALFAASWERMVLLAGSLAYRPEYELPMPIGDVDHYIPALEAALACVMQHDEAFRNAK